MFLSAKDNMFVPNILASVEKFLLFCMILKRSETKL